MTQHLNRRRFLHLSGLAAIATGCQTDLSDAQSQSKERYPLSLHPYSLRSLWQSGEVTLETYPEFVRKNLQFDNIEYDVGDCQSLYDSPAKAAKIHQLAAEQGIKIQTVLCGASPALDADSKSERQKAVEGHLRWAEVAHGLGAKALRIRASTEGGYSDRLEKAADSISNLCDRIQDSGVTPCVENIGGQSRNPQWLVQLVSQVGPDRIKLIADFGNFNDDYYGGVKTMLPFCHALCTKSWDFDANGNETKIDFERMMRIVKRSSFRGCIAIEYLGTTTPHVEGILKTAALIKRYS